MKAAKYRVGQRVYFPFLHKNKDGLTGPKAQIDSYMITESKVRQGIIGLEVCYKVDGRTRSDESIELLTIAERKKWGFPPVVKHQPYRDL